MSLFELPELDEKKTKKAVEQVFEKYRMYKFLDFEERESSITGTIKDIVVSQSGISNQTSDIAIYNADTKAYQKRFCNDVERAVKKLPQKERFLIENRYIHHEAEYMTDLKMYTRVFQPPIGHKFYYKLQWKAFYKIALALNLNITKD